MNLFINISIKVGLLGLLLFSFYSCALTIPKENRQCFEELKQFAKENWTFTKNDSILIENSKLFQEVGSKNSFVHPCIKKMSKNEIIKIFGKPHEIQTIKYRYKKEVTQFYYYLWDCYPSISSVKTCNYYYFDFDTNGLCLQIGTGGKERSH